MAVALQILASGFATGAVYGLVAAGQSIVFRLTGVVNFAFGELIALEGRPPPPVRALPRNPDPAGSSTTVYVYRSAVPPAIPVAVQPVEHGRDWTMTIAVAAGVLLAAGAGLAMWARA